jgi:hypothetical protein
VRRIGFRVGEVDSAIAQRRVAALQQGLRELGWIEGRNIHIEYRWAILDADRIRRDAADLVALNLEVIVTTGAPSLAALLQITRSIPIVFTFVTDPVKDGFAELQKAGLTHPLTGTLLQFSFMCQQTASQSPVSVEADIRAFGRHSGYDPSRKSSSKICCDAQHRWLADFWEVRVGNVSTLSELRSEL